MTYSETFEIRHKLREGRRVRSLSPHYFLGIKIFSKHKLKYKLENYWSLIHGGNRVEYSCSFMAVCACFMARVYGNRL